MGLHVWPGGSAPAPEGPLAAWKQPRCLSLRTISQVINGQNDADSRGGEEGPVCFHAFILKSVFPHHLGNPGLLRHAGPGPGGLRRDVQHHLTTRIAALLQSLGKGPGTCYQDSFIWKKNEGKINSESQRDPDESCSKRCEEALEQISHQIVLFQKISFWESSRSTC